MSQAHVMKMCKDGMFEAEMLKMHPDADKDKLKQLIQGSKEMKESIQIIWDKLNKTRKYQTLEESVGKPTIEEEFDILAEKQDACYSKVKSQIQSLVQGSCLKKKKKSKKVLRTGVTRASETKTNNRHPRRRNTLLERL